MPYIARLYGMRKKIVPTTSVASMRPDDTRYAAANGNAVLTQLSGRLVRRRARIMLALSSSGRRPCRDHAQQCHRLGSSTTAATA